MQMILLLSMLLLLGRLRRSQYLTGRQYGGSGLPGSRTLIWLFAGIGDHPRTLRGRR